MTRHFARLMRPRGERSNVHPTPCSTSRCYLRAGSAWGWSFLREMLLRLTGSHFWVLCNPGSTSDTGGKVILIKKTLAEYSEISHCIHYEGRHTLSYFPTELLEARRASPMCITIGLQPVASTTWLIIWKHTTIGLLLTP